MVIFALAVREKRMAVTTVARRVFLEIQTVRLSLRSHAWRQLSYKVLLLPRNFSSFFRAQREKFSPKIPPRQLGLMKDVNCYAPQVCLSLCRQPHKNIRED